MRRREFVACGVSGLLAGPAWAAASDVAVEIALNGQTYRYDGGAGTDLGPYTDPQGQFIQDCIRVNHPQLPLSVFIRPDRGSDRLEVIFELSRLWSNDQAQNLPAYQAKILKGTTELASIDVPIQGWLTRWRWQSASRPVRVKASQLMDQWLMPQLSERLRPVSQPMRAERYQPMGLAGLTAYMGSTGEREEIGLMTEAQAQYLCNGSSAALVTMMAQADAAGTYPFVIRDEKTNAPLDVFAYPKATTYGQGHGEPYIRSIKTPAQADHAHQPALTYMPFLLTGDPYYLEQLQLMATWNVTWRPWEYRYRTTQIRGEAWSLRTWSQVAKVTPDVVPKWMLPRLHWQKLLDSYLNFYLKTFVAGTEPPRTIFRTTAQDFGDNRDGLVEGTYIAPWQDEFLAAVLGWMVLMGYSAWRPVFEWKIGSTIARTNGQTGWPRSECTPYRMVMRASSNAPWAQSWKECWDLTAAGLKIQASDPDALDLRQLFYFPYTRGALVLAKHLQIPGVEPSLAWCDTALDRALAARKPFTYKWALV